MYLFSKLLQVKYFEFSSKCGEKSLTDWNVYGHGTVTVQQNNNSIYFKENGSLKLNISGKVLIVIT